MEIVAMSTVLIDAATAETTVEVRTEDGKLVGVFTPRREATREDYERAMRDVTSEEIERSLASGPGRPFREAIDELRRKHGT